MVWYGMVWFYGLDSRPLCLPVEQMSFPTGSLVQGNLYPKPPAVKGVVSAPTIFTYIIE